MIPLLLSTERFDGSVLLGAMGGGLKKTAKKLAGCLYLVVCIPILIFAFFSGQWTSALITVAVTLVIFIVIFKLIERNLPKDELVFNAKQRIQNLISSLANNVTV